MEFKRDAQLDTSEVEGVRESGGRMSSVPGGGLAVGGVLQDL